jgi:transglutaminase/protease-like cytokinesis protein 3
MQRLVFSLTLLFFINCGLNAQPQPNFAAADEFARSLDFQVKNRQALDSLVKLVDRRFALPEEKIRALFTWIATHLEYDCGNDSVPPLRSISIDQVLKSGKSQCAGYSNLLQHVLKQLGLDAVTIKGVAKTSKKDLWWTEQDLKANHSWNAVNLKGQWKLLDATWASGAADDSCNTVTREFSPFYFFPDPEKFALSHLPTDSSWQLIDPPLQAPVFVANPVFHDPYYEHEVKSFIPEKGVLKLKLNEMINFEFESSTPIEKIAVWSEDNLAVKPEFGRFIRKGDRYSYTYRVRNAGNYFLNLSLDGRRTALVYYLNVQ